MNGSNVHQRIALECEISCYLFCSFLFFGPKAKNHAKITIDRYGRAKRRLHKKSETIYAKQREMKIYIWPLFKTTQFKLSIKLSMANEHKKGPTIHIYIDSFAFSNKISSHACLSWSHFSRKVAKIIVGSQTPNAEVLIWKVKIGCSFGWCIFFFHWVIKMKKRRSRK